MNRRHKVCLPFFSLLLLAFFLITSNVASAQCPLALELPLEGRTLWSSPLDPVNGNYFVARSGEELRLFEVVNLGSVQVVEKALINVPDDQEVSLAFSDGDLVVSRWKASTPNGDNSTPSSLESISFVRLVDGQLNTARALTVPSTSLLPSRSANAPFFTSAWPFKPWNAPFCSGASSANGQIGRLVGALGTNLYIANGHEQENSCNQNPLYYQYHLQPNGQPEQEIVRTGVNSQGVPTGLPICDLNSGFFTVSSCAGTISDTCQALNSSGQPVSVPGACSMRLQPRPVRSFEFCPTCPFWWSTLDAGGVVVQTDGLGGYSQHARFTIPASLADLDPQDPGSLALPPSSIEGGRITSIASDALGQSGFAVAVDIGSTVQNLNNFGAILFYDPQGAYLGSGKILIRGLHLGEGGALSPLGAGTFAAGSGRSIPKGSGGWNFPAGVRPDLVPEGGAVAYFGIDGDVLNVDYGIAPGEQFGSALVGIGDTNRDGAPDILIGAPGGDYAALSSVASQEEGQLAGVFYRLLGPPGTEFGRQVAGVSSVRNSLADLVVVGSRDAIRVYDISSCTNGLTPADNSRDRLRGLIPGAIQKIANLNPNPGGNIPVINKLLPFHPHSKQLSIEVSEISEILRRSSDIIPSNEEIISASLDQALYALNINLNLRDVTRAELVTVNKNIKKAKIKCKIFHVQSYCKSYKKLLKTKAKLEKQKKKSISKIKTARGLLLKNLKIVRDELNAIP